jgi:hypothetical protein
MLRVRSHARRAKVPNVDVVAAARTTGERRDTFDPTFPI